MLTKRQKETYSKMKNFAKEYDNHIGSWCEDEKGFDYKNIKEYAEKQIELTTSDYEDIQLISKEEYEKEITIYNRIVTFCNERINSWYNL